jgi:hypothetical protein
LELEVANLKAGVIGLGIMGRNHARVLSTLDGVDLVGIVDPGISDKDVSNFAPIFSEIDQLLLQKIDYCLVAVPTALHEEIGIKLANAGVHALIETRLHEQNIPYLAISGSPQERLEIAQSHISNWLAKLKA